MNPQDEIKQILFNNDKTKVWLADKLHVSKQQLSYELNHSKDISKSLYDKILNIFRAEGFIVATGQKIELIKDQLLTVSQVNCNNIALILSQFKIHSSDGVIDFNERKELSDLVETCRNKTNNELDKLQKFISKG